MRVLVAYFSQMGRSGCGEDPTLLLATLPKHISSWEGVASVQTNCLRAPGKWMPFVAHSLAKTGVCNTKGRRSKPNRPAQKR